MLKIEGHGESYFAEDGNYGDAAGMVVIDTSHFTAEDWVAIEDASDYDRVAAALEVANKYH